MTVEVADDAGGGTSAVLSVDAAGAGDADGKEEPATGADVLGGAVLMGTSPARSGALEGDVDGVGTAAFAASEAAGRGAAADCGGGDDAGCIVACGGEGAAAGPITVATMMGPVATDGATVVAGVPVAGAVGSSEVEAVAAAAAMSAAASASAAKTVAFNVVPAPAWSCKLICSPTDKAALVWRTMGPAFVWRMACPCSSTAAIVPVTTVPGLADATPAGTCVRTAETVAGPVVVARGGGVAEGGMVVMAPPPLRLNCSGDSAPAHERP